MIQGLFALLGAVLGVLLSGVAAESYKRHRDRQGAASAIAGEILAVLNLTEKRNYIAAFIYIAEELEAGRPTKVPDILQRPITLEPVVTAYLDRLGLFGGTVPERPVG